MRGVVPEEKRRILEFCGRAVFGEMAYGKQRPAQNLAAEAPDPNRSCNQGLASRASVQLDAAAVASNHAAMHAHIYAIVPTAHRGGTILGTSTDKGTGTAVCVEK